MGLALTQLAPHGQLAFVLPESFIRLPRYRDVRTVLSQAGAVRVFVNPVGTFSVTSVSCVIMLSKGPSQNHIIYQDCRQSSQSVEVSIVGADWPVYRSAWAAKCHQGSGPRLGDWVTIKEGAHDLYFEPGPGLQPVRAVDDGRLGTHLSLGTTTAFLKQLRTESSHHLGERLVIRKTGAFICAAVVNTTELAYAHQNVYVVKRKVQCPMTIDDLVLLLNEPLLTELYQQSPMGQPNQPMAQLRISALRDLPIPDALMDKYELE